MGLRRYQTSIIVGFAPTTHANSPTYTTPSPPITMARYPHILSPLTRKSCITTLPHPPRRKSLQLKLNPPPSLTTTTDSITPRTKQWLSWLLATLDGRFDLRWTRNAFALKCWGQVVLWQEGQRVCRPHFLERSLVGAGLILTRCVTPPPCPAVPAIPNSPSARRPLLTGQRTVYLRLTWKCEVGAHLGLKRLIWG